MKKEELIDPVYEKQEGEKSTHYNILAQFFLHPTDNLKEFYDVLKNEYEQDLEKYEKNIEYYNFIESHRIKTLKLKNLSGPKSHRHIELYNHGRLMNFGFIVKNVF